MSTLTSISPRFEIRKLGPEHLDWAKAIATHTNVFHSPLWPIIYPDNKTGRAYALYKTVEYLVQHQINSGLSYGVFDKEYEFKRPESAKTGGAFYWDLTDTTATSKQLLEQMDFPLVSIALALDASNPLDMSRLKQMVDVLPFFATGYHHLHELYTHDPAMLAVKGPGEVMLRNGTSTRADYMGRRTMKKMAHFLMHEAASRGFRGIKIEAFHPAVHHVWMNPPAPFKATLLAMFNVKDYEEEVDGKKVVPYPDLDLDLSSMYIALR